MEKEKFKRDHLPQLRRCTKELEDAIIEKDESKEIEAIEAVEKAIKEIKSSRYIAE